MEGRTRALRNKIERLRNEMVLKFVQNGADLSDAEVLSLSQQLDELLNRYERSMKYEPNANPLSLKIGRFPAFAYKNGFRLMSCNR
ncbi:aspartyl-phosphate phosphatase Spo0E family protein [Cohnella endophytica]|uniref:Aspartyl-phosphate phosphatase Spo0E family protein n=1 Tax=Cohnella endophytica TaxID=2419778 RepID=A0A494Y2B7_9BACL|nr:aspartyl-phosphate phosphatase Spo0E family protein [Cohnella endophytica]RKP56140.1 aspartyl-phosphate phosphatase Spo0E family protein [Cohnella endophytica]